jgi:hypothetical protein
MGGALGNPFGEDACGGLAVVLDIGSLPRRMQAAGGCRICLPGGGKPYELAAARGDGGPGWAATVFTLV